MSRDEHYTTSVCKPQHVSKKFEMVWDMFSVAKPLQELHDQKKTKRLRNGAVIDVKLHN